MRKNLEYIIKVAEYGNINKAAQHLFITPSALSKFIITKERELGVALFDRSGKKFVLTYAGEKYVDWAKRIVSMQESMNREMLSIAEEKIGIMHFGFQLMQSKIIFSRIIPEFKKDFKEIEIVLESTYTLNLLNKLKEGSIDFAISSHSSKKEGLIYKKLSEIEIVVIVPKGHWICEKAILKDGFNYPWVDIRDLENETFVGLYTDQEPRKVMDSVFEEFGLSPKLNMQVHTSEMTVLSVANNFGITIGYDLPAKYDEYKGTVELLSFGEKPVIRDLSVIYREDFTPNNFTNSFFDMCKKFYNEV